MNRFIVIEGGEACGKSTQVRLLKERLERDGHQVVTTHEPGGTPYGAQVRELFFKYHSDISPLSQAMLLLSSKLHLLNTVINPALEDGIIVITDRYNLSLLVYQGLLGGRNNAVTIYKLLETLEFGNRENNPSPLMFFLDCEPEISVARTAARKLADGEFNSMDSLDIERHKSIRRAFHMAIENRLMGQTDTEVIDVSVADIQAVHEQIYSKVKGYV